MSFNIDEVRSHFPALESLDIFFDGPGGTQVPQVTIDAMTRYLITSNANFHGAFVTSRRTDETTAAARCAMADFLNARYDDEIVFGSNMTTLTFHLSRAIGRTLQAGDEIIVTRLDHDANIAPWLALEEMGAVIRWIDFNPVDCTLTMSDFQKYLNERTKVVAVGYSSNAFGTVNDVKTITTLAHEAGALMFVDAVHFTPHAPIDVQDLNCDFLVCSAYKFFGPHVGILYGKYHVLDRLRPYKVRPSANKPPDKFETGTQIFEGQAGITATIDFLASIGARYATHLESPFKSFDGRRLHLKTAMSLVESYERRLFAQLMDGLQRVPGITVFGITDPERYTERAPTVAFTMKGYTPNEIATELGRNGIYVWDGHYYAVEPMKRLGLLDRGGAVRVGLSLYNTGDEVSRFLSIMENMVQGRE